MSWLEDIFLIITLDWRPPYGSIFGSILLLDSQNSLASEAFIVNLTSLLIISYLSIIADYEFFVLCRRFRDFQICSDPDICYWKWNPNGTLSTASVYKLFFAGSTSDSISNTVWYCSAPPRVQFFMWLLFKDRILTLDNLWRRGWILASRCELCLNASEDIIHLFLQCPYSTAV